VVDGDEEVTRQGMQTDRPTPDDARVVSIVCYDVWMLERVVVHDCRHEHHAEKRYDDPPGAAKIETKVINKKILG